VRPSIAKSILKQINCVIKVSWSACSDGQNEYERCLIVMGEEICGGVMVEVSYCR
jgi:hypothetical protein